MECRECHKEINEIDQFCPKCGSRVQKVCSQCKSPIDERDIFCRKCGSAILDTDSETASLEVAKALAHRLNNALSIILTSSQLALYQIKDLSGKTANDLQKLLNDIAVSADNSGGLIHQFQKYIDSIEQKRPEKESETFAHQIESRHQLDFSSELRTFDSDESGLIGNPSSSKKQVSILIVDDEDKIRYAMSYALTLGGHSVITASNGQEALELIKSRYYDIAFVDLILPDMDGWEIVNSIGQTSPNTNIVLMTGWNVGLDDEKLKKANLDTVLTKPFQLSDVTDLIKSALEK